MQEIKKVLSLHQRDYYETHLSIINCILPIKLTPKEIEVLACFMSLEGDITNYRFGRLGKKVVMDYLRIQSSGLANYMRDLKKKSMLKEDSNGNITILPILLPGDKVQEYRFRLMKDTTSVPPPVSSSIDIIIEDDTTEVAMPIKHKQEEEEYA